MKKKVYDYNVETSTAIVPGITLGQVQTAINSSVDYALRKDSADDWRACVELNVSSYATYNPSAARPDPINSQVLQQTHIINMNNGTISFVNQHTFARGCATGGEDADLRRIIIDWNGKWVDSIVHEFGHNRGLNHPNPSKPLYIMDDGRRRTQGGGHLAKDEAKAYDSGP
jgi:hypothetical protein